MGDYFHLVSGVGILNNYGGGQLSLPGPCGLLITPTLLQDKKDVEKTGATPLSDNRPSDRYLYVLIVHTGQLPNSGTESKVGHTT